jgi:hypothetical protein
MLVGTGKGTEGGTWGLGRESKCRNRIMKRGVGIWRRQGVEE